MGKIPQGVFGGVSGKIGNLIGAAWKGIAYLRSAPLSVSQPNTAAQIAQKTKFGNTVEVAVILLADIIKPLWDRFASKMSGFNAFVKTNIDLFTTVTPNPPADFEIAHGKMAATTIASATGSDEHDRITFAWTDDSGSGYKLSSDLAYVVAYNVDNADWGFSETGISRSAESCILYMPNFNNTGDVIHCYLAFKRADGTIVSMTSYYAETIQSP